MNSVCRELKKNFRVLTFIKTPSRVENTPQSEFLDSSWKSLFVFFLFFFYIRRRKFHYLNLQSETFLNYSYYRYFRPLISWQIFQD